MTIPEAPTAEPLAADIGTTDWAALAAPAERDGQHHESTALHLVEAALAIAEDDVARVSAWLDAGQLGKPDADDIRRFKTGPKNYFQFVVVQPFVVAMEIDLEGI